MHTAIIDIQQHADILEVTKITDTIQNSFVTAHTGTHRALGAVLVIAHAYEEQYRLISELPLAVLEEAA